MAAFDHLVAQLPHPAFPSGCERLFIALPVPWRKPSAAAGEQDVAIPLFDGRWGGFALRLALLAGTALVAPAHAQDATWHTAPVSTNFSTGLNWDTGFRPTGTAFFGTSTITNLSFANDVTIGGWTFNANAANYSFSNNRILEFTGAGIVVNGGSATISNSGDLYFRNASSAGIASIIDIYRVRRLIECQALAQAYPRHPAKKHMREAVEMALKCREAGDWLGVGTANMEFHMAIVELADSERLNNLFAHILVELRLAFGLLKDPEFLHAPYVDMNMKLLELIEAGKFAEGSAALNDYLVHSERIVLAVYARSMPEGGIDS